MAEDLTIAEYAAARHDLLLRRIAGLPPRQDTPKKLLTHKFCNVYRFADRASQALIHIINEDSARGVSFADTLFKIMLFRAFNRSSTWDVIQNAHPKGVYITRATFDHAAVDDALGALARSKKPVYHGAYNVSITGLGDNGGPNNLPPPGQMYLGHTRLFTGPLIDFDKLATSLSAAGSLAETTKILRKLPTMGRFTGFQIALDVGYTQHVSWREATATPSDIILGPGARRGAMLSGLLPDPLTKLQHQLRDMRCRGVAPSLADAEHTFCEYQRFLSPTWVKRYVGHDEKGEIRRVPHLVLPTAWAGTIKGEVHDKDKDKSTRHLRLVHHVDDSGGERTAG